MSKTVIKTVVLLLAALATGAAANPIGYGGFSAFADPSGYEWDIDDSQPGLLPLYVVPWGVQATAVQFSARKPACFEAVYVGETSPYSVIIGDSQNGISIAYGACMTTPSVILIINYFVQGLTPECCWYPLDKDIADPHGLPGQITFADCSDPPQVGHAIAGASVVNWNPGCDTPVELSTWGLVKSLYQR